MSLLSNEYRLSNDTFSSYLNVLGNGRLVARECFLTSHRPSSDDGIFFFVRDVESKRSWSATPAPTFARPETFRMEVGARSARIERTDDRIETTLHILVPETGTFEIRKLSLTNRGEKRRRLEVTSSLDIILLHDRLRDSHHQTFSNMFIGAEFLPTLSALLYHRRFFDDPERFPIFMHRFFLEAPAEFLGFETDREAFIGRGRPMGRPIALDSPLKNTSGYILDPLANLRAGISLEPGESYDLFCMNSAHFSPETPLSFSEQFPKRDAVRACFEREFETDRKHRREIPSLPIDRLFPEKDPFTPSIENQQDISRFDSKPLLFWNGFGGFDPETGAYQMRIRPESLPPQPWANILANPDFGTMTTENALGTTWWKNSKYGRLSPWSNNAVTDPPSEAIFIRPVGDTDHWSLTPAPVPASSEYIVTHGRGYTRYESARGAIRHTLTVSIDPERAFKHYAIEIENSGEMPGSFEIFLFLDAPSDAETLEAPPESAIRFLPEENAFFFGREAFCPQPTPQSVRRSATLLADHPFECLSRSKEAAFGVAGVFSPRFHPLPKTAEASDHLPRFPHDACFITSARLLVAEGGTARIIFTLCAGESESELRTRFPAIREEWSSGEPFSLSKIHAFWGRNGKAPTIETPDQSLDILFNTRLPYQTLVSRMWAKMGFYQPGGAFGLRDQLQDAIALWYLEPEETRKHILASARQQYEDGSARSWWFPDSDFGVRSAASDQTLWIPWAVMEYIRLSGDRSILNEEVSFFADSPHHDPTRFDVRQETEQESRSSVLEHCLRSIEYSSSLGIHGLPLMREGDWNDGMNRVGHRGKGESVWLGFFLFSILEQFSRILNDCGKSDIARIFRERATSLGKNLNDAGWDGHWFRRAFSDDGEPVGSEKNEECRIDAIAQSWSVLSGAGMPEKAREAMENMERFLYDPESRILKLLDPPFNDLSTKNPGYIKDYPPGIRENGSQYNHAVFWAAEAFARIGRRDKVYELLLAANPIRRSESERKALLYEVEPYAVAADIYSAEHRGKGGWTWYTASAGLMYRTVIETLFGIRIAGNALTLQPSFPNEWEHARITLTRRSNQVTLDFCARSIPHKNAISEIRFDGTLLETTGDLLFPDDAFDHRYEIVLT